MKEVKNITTFLLDIGGVLLTNGWGHESRNLAAEKFNLDIPEMEVRHNIAHVDPTFRFMTVDWDGQLRMDPSLPYGMHFLNGK
jgi:hypothetical protein